MAAVIGVLIWLTPSRDSGSPAPLPTGLSPALAARLNSPNAPASVCQLHDSAMLIVTADCTDCWLYPVDKAHALSSTYTPVLVQSKLRGGGALTPTADAALSSLFAAAERQKFKPRITSAYRSYKDQAWVFQTWVLSELREGVSLQTATERASAYSAQAGHSEHQLGTAVDLNCDECRAFDRSDSRNWKLWDFLAGHAHKYGFVVSYPKGLEALTGYDYEPWHLRYIGVLRATDLYNQGYLNESGACIISHLNRFPLR